MGGVYSYSPPISLLQETQTHLQELTFFQSGNRSREPLLKSHLRVFYVLQQYHVTYSIRGKGRRKPSSS